MSDNEPTTDEMEEQETALTAVPMAPIGNKRAALTMVEAFGWTLPNAKSVVTKWCRGSRPMRVGQWRAMLLRLDGIRRRIAFARSLIDGSGLMVVPERFDGEILDKRETCRVMGELAVAVSRAHADAAAGVLSRDTCRQLGDALHHLGMAMDEAPDDSEEQVAK